MVRGQTEHQKLASRQEVKQARSGITFNSLHISSEMNSQFNPRVLLKSLSTSHTSLIYFFKAVFVHSLVPSCTLYLLTPSTLIY